MKRVLVTGGGGFIGRNLINRLVAIGGYCVTCLDMRPINYFTQGVTCVEGLFSDSDLLDVLLRDVDVVVHLGSNALPANADYVADVEHNLLGSIALIRACEENGVKKLVFASSGGTVYGPTDRVPTKETDPENPICSYGIIKMTIEKYLELASRTSGIQSVVLRISNPYGPWQNWNSKQGAVSVFCHKLIAGEPITIFGDGSARRDFVYIDDVVSAIVSAMSPDVKTNCFNIGSGVPVEMREIVAKLAGVLRKSYGIIYAPPRKCDVPCSALDVTKALNVLKWSPQVALDEGLRKLVEWQVANPGAFPR